MSFLTINGMPLPILAGSLSTSEIEIGERGDAFSGAPFNALRRVKVKRSFRTPAMSQADAAGWKAILRGLGVTWAFAADLYSDQGHPEESGSEFVSWSSGAVNIAAELGAYAEWDVGAGSDYFVQLWWDGDSWALSSDGTKYHNGSTVSAWGDVGIAFSSGHLRISNATGTGSVSVSNVIYLPAVPSAAMILALAGVAAYPALPQLTLDGDVVPSPVYVTGSVAGASVVNARIGGVFCANAEELSVDLVEV